MLSSRLATNRYLIRTVLLRFYASDRSSGSDLISKWHSVVGKPLVQSPFDNPRRILTAKSQHSSIEFSSNSQSNDGSKKIVEKPIDNVQSYKSSADGSFPPPTAADGSSPPPTAADGSSPPPPAADGSSPPPPAANGSSPPPPAGSSETLNVEIIHKISAYRRLKNWLDGPSTEGLSDAEKFQYRTARNTRWGFLVIGVVTIVFIGGSIIYYASPEQDSSGRYIKDQYSDSFFAPLYRIRDGFASWKSYMVEPSRTNLLPDPVKSPWFQPKYTLVLEMKNILVSPQWDYKKGHHFVKRPALDYFLDVCGYPNFELIIYTSETFFTAPSIIEAMDKKHKIAYRLFRDSTKRVNGHYVKDLSRLNRDLSKVIFIDFDPNAFQTNPENGLLVPKWNGDMNDISLVDLAELLKTIHLSDVDDVRPILQHYNQFNNPMTEFRRRAQTLAQQEQQKPEDTKQQKSFLGRYTGNLFGTRRHAV